MQKIDHPGNPFPGLRPFESSETHLFFGRDGQSEELLRRLKRTRFLAVVGTSGSGKSSLVRAGLLPALQGGLMASAGSDWRIAILRPGGDPIGNLARALASPAVLGSRDEKSAAMQDVLAETTLRRSSLGLVELVSRARTKVNDSGQPLFPEYENLLVVVDQFEELFRFKQLIEEENSKEDAAAFVRLLLEAVEQKAEKIYVVLTMRSDFLGDCSQFWELPEAINNGQYLIPRMTRDERREAISGPVAVGQGEISEPLVNQLLNDVGDNPDQLPILQHALMRTWDHWLSHRDGEPMDIPDYNAIGGMASALSRHADEACEELSETQKAIAEKLFKGLTEKGKDNREIRRPMEIQEICELTGAGEAAVIAVVEVFRREGRSFLMPPPTDASTGAPVPLNGESLIDISHESLIRNWERLKTWVDEEAQSARIYKRLAETAMLHKAGEEALLVDPALQGALDWREKNRPNAVWARRYHPEFETAVSFLDASAAARDAEVQERERRRRTEVSYRRTKLAALLLALSLLLSVGSAVYAIRQSREAKQQRDYANMQREKAKLAEAQAVRQAGIAGEQARLALEAKAIARRAKEQSLHLLYAADLNLAQSEYTAGRFDRANRLLERFSRPIVERGTADEPHQDLRGFEWYCLWRAFHSKKPSLIRHKDTVTAVAYSPDGKILATGGADKTVKLWSTDPQREIGSRENLSAAIVALTFSPNGKILACGDGNNVRLIETNTQQIVATLQAGIGTVGSLAFSPDGKTLTVGRDRDIELWDASTLQPLATLKGHSDYITSLAYSPDGQVLATGSAEVKLWDIASHREMASLIQQERVTSLAFSPNGKVLAIGWGKRARLLEISSLRISAQLVGHASSVISLAFSPDGKTLATGGYTIVDFWDVASGRELATSQTAGTSLSFSPDGTTLAIGGGDTTVKLLDVASPPALSVANTGQVKSLAFSPDGKTLAMGSYSGLKSRDIQHGFEFTLTENSSTVHAVAFSPDGKFLAAGTESEGIKLWDTSTRNDLTLRTGDTDAIRAKGAIRCVTFSPDGKVLVAGEGRGAVTLLDTKTLTVIRLLNTDNPAMSAAFSPDGKLLAVGDHSGNLKVWETDSYERFTVRKDAAGIRTVAFSPDGKTVVTSGDEKTVYVWDLNLSTDEPVKLEGHTDRVMSLAFSPDGKTLATGSMDRTVKLWDTHSYQELMTLNGAGEAVTFSPDGKTLAVGEGYQIYFWHAATDKEVLAQVK